MNILKDKKNKGLILALAAAVFWGYMGIPSKHLQNLGITPFSVAFYRTSVAAVLFALYAIKKDFKSLKVNIKSLLFFMFYGIVAIAGSFIGYNVSINYVPIALGTMLMFTCPFWVVILSFFLFKEKFTIKKIISMILTLIGCFMVCKIYKFGSMSINIKGIIFGLGSGFAFSMQTILAKVAAKKYNQRVFLFYSFLFASLFLIPFINLKSTIAIVVNSSNSIFIIKNILILGIVNTFIANGSYITSVKYIKASTASIISTLELVIASIFAYFIFNESLDIVQLLGMISVVTAIVLLQLNKENVLKIFKNIHSRYNKTLSKNNFN
ncbi:DMT family transporter [Clostridium oceanicum]|uniref:DMT family transporter n=1 Tax=Clostridium oceanicum TaxID=1543 RepID=A0ABP3UPY6_9CLOT